MQYFLPDSIYNTIKWIGLILCPALAVLIQAVGPAWGIANVDAIVLTINAVGVFIGAIIGASQITVSEA